MQRKERFIYMKIKNYLIGEYDKSVILTYLGAALP